MNRAELADDMDILELVCGWGSLTLAMAKKYPHSRIVGVSNSKTQREWIMAQAQKTSLKNVQILTRDLGTTEDLGLNRQSDRVVTVEMMEHVRNYEVFLKRVSGWLKVNGKMFVHIFVHKEKAYFFETEGDDNWMGKYFFTGGQMPSADLLTHFQTELKLEDQWSWNGMHYKKTCDAWLANMDLHKNEIRKIF